MHRPPARRRQAGGAAGRSSRSLPLLLIFVVFYFLMIRPQQQRDEGASQATIDAVKKGDQVVTGGGLVGKVTKVDDDVRRGRDRAERPGQGASRRRSPT